MIPEINFVQLVLFAIPAFAANAAPLFAGGRTPIDFGKTTGSGNRVLGDGKTIRGFFVGVVAGTLAAAIIAYALGSCFLPQFSFNEKVCLGFLLSFGTMTGDAVGSFVKRRMGIKQGSRVTFLDWLPFIIFALLFGAAMWVPNWPEIIILIALTYLLHRGSNLVAHQMGWKKVPW